ncbi:hypothetical protein BDQ12DRAFT_263655 [Crucibulum laeve]|uniref:Uncharacterized protein n=1 Tax=Crucibulum laeve TaxID=68775 RepID=A0A5C3LU13_9AGAR|nr:hypothetical protein BDQ12DRAFT_263655 [Crucibulum laeve]
MVSLPPLLLLSLCSVSVMVIVHVQTLTQAATFLAVPGTLLSFFTTYTVLKVICTLEMPRVREQ